MTGTWEIIRAQAAGDLPFEVGRTRREHWTVPPADPAVSGVANVPGARFSLELNGSEVVSGIVTVVSATSDGEIYRAQVRAADTADAAAVLLNEKDHLYHRALAERVDQLLSWGARREGDDAICLIQAPETVLSLPEVPLRSPASDGDPDLLSRLRIDKNRGWLWTIVPATERDKGVANCGKSHIALCHALTAERKQLVRDLYTEFSALRVWSIGGYNLQAAEILTASGWTMVALRRDAGALDVLTKYDARVFVSKPFDWWVASGWGRRVDGFAPVPASEAVQLADAGVSATVAAELQAKGHATLNEKLDAADFAQLGANHGEL